MLVHNVKFWVLDFFMEDSCIIGYFMTLKSDVV